MLVANKLRDAFDNRGILEDPHVSQAIHREKFAPAPGRGDPPRAFDLAGAVICRMHDQRWDVECGRRFRQNKRCNIHAARPKRIDEVIGIDAFFLRVPAHVALPSLRRGNERNTLSTQAGAHRERDRRAAA